MLLGIVHETKQEHRRLAIAGIVIILSTALLIGLSIAIYMKAFTPVTMVTIKAENAGQQLSRYGDVRRHGVLIGQFRSVKQDSEQASIKVALEPDAAKVIPNNSTVEIIPTTLFGQKFISFNDGANPSTTPLRDGDVISSDRVSTNVELQSILADLFPLLRSIRPADLNTTLYSLATALQGRGEQLGQTIEDLDSYLKTMNQHLPTLREDLTLFSDVADTYDMAAPDIVSVLRNATVTANTVNRQSQQLGVLFSDMTTTATVTTRVLETNEDALVKEGKLVRPLARLLDTYSPQYVCMLQALSINTDVLGQVFRGNTVRQAMDLDAKQHKSYTKADRPVNGEAGANQPWCLGLPNPAVPFKGAPLRNGYAPAANPEGARN
jgi:phospholipid/cholesterol/gamma-HCH transport system substrate-binding protein